MSLANPVKLAPDEYFTTLVNVALEEVLVKAVIKLPELLVSAPLAAVIVTDPPVALERVALGVPRTTGVCPLIVDEVVRVATVEGAAVTVNVKICVVLPLAFVAVTVKAVALATLFGVPESAPVVVLKLIPEGVALMPKLAMVPPVEEAIVNPVAAVLTVLVSADALNVKAGAASATVKVNVCVALPVALVAVIVYAVALCVEVGVPLSNPVVVLNVRPAGAAGEIA